MDSGRVQTQNTPASQPEGEHGAWQPWHQAVMPPSQPNILERVLRQWGSFQCLEAVASEGFISG